MKARVFVGRGPEMNGTEKAFADSLSKQTLAGEIVRWTFESVTLKLGDNCRYTPDFYVLMSDGSVTFYEVKGFWRDDARVKIKAAASKFPSKMRPPSWRRQRIRPPPGAPKAGTISTPGLTKNMKIERTEDQIAACRGILATMAMTLVWGVG
jgi:hypothetical protein